MGRKPLPVVRRMGIPIKVPSPIALTVKKEEGLPYWKKPIIKPRSLSVFGSCLSGSFFSLRLFFRNIFLFPCHGSFLLPLFGRVL
jgi:hypothetical protein